MSFDASRSIIAVKHSCKAGVDGRFKHAEALAFAVDKETALCAEAIKSREAPSKKIYPKEKKAVRKE